MTLLTVQPFTMKDCLMTIGADDFARHLSSVKFTPNVTKEKVEWQGLTPDATFTDTSAPVTDWVADLAFAQDWESDSSLSQYLLDHAGEDVVAVFEPKRGVGKRFTSTLTLPPPQIGGDVKTVAVGTASCEATEPVPSDIP